MAEILVLRLIHIIAGVLWVGAAVFNAFLLMPVLATLGPAAGPVVGGLQRRGLFTFLPVTALLTILAGLRLMWLTSDGFSAEYFGSARGATFGAAGAAATLAFVVGMLVARPLGVRIGGLAAELGGGVDAGRADSIRAEMASLQRRNRRINNALAILLLASVAGMAVARYLA